MLARASLVAFLLLFVWTTSGAASMGAYYGVGPSTWSDGHTRCSEAVSVALAPSAQASGLWALDLTCGYASPVNTDQTEVGYTGWPMILSDELVGSPETGFHDEGVIESFRSTWVWQVVVGPVGPATSWALHYELLNEHGSRHIWWNGTADMTGAHV